MPYILLVYHRIGIFCKCLPVSFTFATVFAHSPKKLSAHIPPGKAQRLDSSLFSRGKFLRRQEARQRRNKSAFSARLQASALGESPPSRCAFPGCYRHDVPPPRRTPVDLPSAFLFSVENRSFLFPFENRFRFCGLFCKNKPFSRFFLLLSNPKK